MAFLLLLVMLTACAASPQDMSGKIVIFPEETDTAYMRLKTSEQKFSAATVCLRSITDLSRHHVLFSLATPSADNAFVIYKPDATNALDIHIQNNGIKYVALDYNLNAWHSICSTWDSQSGLVQLWLDGKPSIKKLAGGSEIQKPIAILGQEQDNHGGGFDIKQCFVGMMCEVHMWNYVLSPCEIKRYVDGLNFTPGNLINWRALEYETKGKVLIENKPTPCDVPTANCNACSDCQLQCKVCC